MQSGYLINAKEYIEIRLRNIGVWFEQCAADFQKKTF